jgi:aspartate aminotransferase
MIEYEAFCRVLLEGEEVMLSKRVQGIRDSMTLKLLARANLLKKQGEQVVSFTVGEPDFDTPDSIKAAAIKAIEEGFTKYTPVSGIPELKEAVATRYREEHGIHYDMDQVLISCGAKHSIYNVIQSVCGPGDEVIIPVPYWLSFPEAVRLAGAEPVFLPREESEGFRLDPDRLAERVTPRTRLMILNCPCNPTGTVLRREDLEAIAGIAAAHDFFVLSDEIYEYVTYGDYRHLSIAAVREAMPQRTIIVSGVSKTYAMTGWRIGWAVGPKEIIQAATRLQSHSTSGANSIAQKAAVEALRGDQSFVRQMVEVFDKRRRYTIERLRSMPGLSVVEPHGAFFAFPNVSSYYGIEVEGSKIDGSLSFSNYCIAKAGLIMVPGIVFGSDEHVRLSYATGMEHIETGLGRLERMLKLLTMYKQSLGRS